MDPKVFFETGQTTGKNISGNATDTSGETAKQAGKAFKEAFIAANAAGKVDSEAASSRKTDNSEAITAAESPDPKATKTFEKLHYTVNPSTGNVDSSVRELMAKAPPDYEALASDQPVVHGKSLPHSQETGKFDPPDNKLGSDLARDPEALVNGTKTEADSQRWVPETVGFISREARDAARVASDSQPVDSKTGYGHILRVKSPQGMIEIALPNGPASRSEVVEFAKSQSLPNSFIDQVLSGFRESTSPALNDSLLAEQMTTATRVVEVDAGESELSATKALLPEKGTFDHIEQLASSTIFIDQLASVLAPKSEGNPPIQKAVEIDRGEVTALIKQTLSSNYGFATKTNVATYELSSEAIQIRGAVIDAIGADKVIKLSDFHVNKLANLLERKFVSTVSPRGEGAVKTQPPVKVTSAVQMMRANSFWALTDNGDLTTSKVQLDAEHRFGVSATATGTPDRPSQIELDSSIMAAQKLVGPNPKGPSSAQGKFEILDVEAQTREKTFTSSDALNIRHFADSRGAENAPTARPLSSNSLVSPVSSDPQSLVSAAPLTNAENAPTARPLSSNALVSPVLSDPQSLVSAAPLTNSVSDQSGLSYVSASGTGYPLVSRSTNNDGSRAIQYQSSVNPVRDVVALSERFSQVLTERLVQNVKSGNYNLRFNVHPRELGAVDIAMEVRDGRLDAQISSTNPITRDLLSESLPRLRDALQAGGLQLSNLEVNDNARDNQKRELMSSNDHDESAAELNETASNLLVEDLTLNAESVDYLA